MIYAVPSASYDRLRRTGALQSIERAVEHDDTAALNAFVRGGDVIQAKDASRHPAGQRDRCYLCGDEVTPCERHDGASYFKHLNNADCIGSSANPAGVFQL
jgi:hypothetical protein